MSLTGDAWYMTSDQHDAYWRLLLPGGHALAARTTLPDRSLQQAQGGTVACPLQHEAEALAWSSGMSTNVCTSSVACARTTVPTVKWCR